MGCQADKESSTLSRLLSGYAGAVVCDIVVVRKIEGSHVAEPIVCGPKLHEGTTGPRTTRITALETLAQVRHQVEGTISFSMYLLTITC
jgi:hypothetical protein